MEGCASPQEEEGKAKDADEQANSRLPIPPGQIRLDGHFHGTVSAGMQCTEVAIPISHEVPYASIEPALRAFLAAAKMEEVDANDTVKSTKLWDDMLKQFSGLMPIDEKEEKKDDDVLEKSNQNVRETAQQMEQIISNISEKTSLMIDTDYKAQEALVHKMMQEREELKKNNAALKKKLETGCMSRIFGRSKANVEESVKHGHDNSDHVPSVKEIEQFGSECPKIDEKSALLSGHFRGNVRTHGHFLDVSLPVDGEVPGILLSEIAHVLANLNASTHASNAGTASIKALPSIWGGLVQILTDEYPSDESEHGDARMLAMKNKQLTAHVEALSQELAQVREDHSKNQSEAVQLRSKNTSLMNFITSAEVSAVNLRKTLDQTGISMDDIDEFKPRLLSPNLPLTPLNRLLLPKNISPRNSPRQTRDMQNSENLGLFATPPMPHSGHTQMPHNKVLPFAGHTEMPRNKVFSPVEPVAHTEMPQNKVVPSRGHTEMSHKVFPSSGHTEQKSTNSILNADIKELERYAHELKQSLARP